MSFVPYLQAFRKLLGRMPKRVISLEERLRTPEFSMKVDEARKRLDAEDAADEYRCPKCAGPTEFVMLHRDGSGRRFFACRDWRCGGGVWSGVKP